LNITVVVVTHNQHDLLRTCLRSVLVAMQGLSGDTIVVDNASMDGTADMMAREFPQVRHLRNDANVHYTRAVNQGVRATQGRYVFILNDDTEMAPDCFRKLIAFMDAHPQCGVVGPRLLSPQGEAQPSAHRFPTPLREIAKIVGLGWRLRRAHWAQALQTTYPMPMDSQPVDWVSGGAMFVRRSAFEAIGLHDENYLFYRDDPDVGMRMKAAGWQVWYYADTYLLHHHGASTVKTPRKVRFDLIAVRSRRHYHRKFHGWTGSLIVETCFGVFGTLQALRDLLNFRATEAARRWREVTLLFLAIPRPKEEADAVEAYSRMPFNGCVDATEGRQKTEPPARGLVEKGALP